MRAKMAGCALVACVLLPVPAIVIALYDLILAACEAFGWR